MRFAWQGFSFETPNDWQPSVLTGGFASGYARLSGSGHEFIQVRWEKSARPAGRSAVETYLNKLSRDAQKAGHRFERKVSDEEHAVRYRYAADVRGCGALFDGEVSGQTRAVFLEAASPGKYAPSSIFKQALASFRFEDHDLRPWRLLGLSVQLPCDLGLQRKELMAGKTLLEFGARGALVRAERWGFAEQLLAHSSLAEWASALSGRRSVSIIEEGPNRLHFRSSQWLRPQLELMAIRQTDQNQITVIRAETRLPGMRAQWNWFD